jgi:homoserine kinase type II
MVSQLEFIQAVLWHVVQEGFRGVPLPLETEAHSGYVRHAGHLWQLEPWLPGRADFSSAPSEAKLQAAMTILARFHQAASSFPLPHAGSMPSPGIAKRYEKLRDLLAGGARQIASAVTVGDWPELAPRAAQLLSFFVAMAESVNAELVEACKLEVAIQPCIRDVWHDHVLFEGPEVSGLVDFGAMRPESVAGDVARLLGSLVGDRPDGWSSGIAAYESIRRLEANELRLVRAFDRSTMLMSGLEWLAWIYIDGRHFENRTAVLARIDDILARLASVALPKP